MVPNRIPGHPGMVPLKTNNAFRSPLPAAVDLRKEDQGDEAGERPRLLRLTMDGYFDGTLGGDPVHQDRPHHGLDLSIFDGAVLIPKPILSADEARRIAANIAKLPAQGLNGAGVQSAKPLLFLLAPVRPGAVHGRALIEINLQIAKSCI